MKIDLIDSMGSDLTVVNAARVSFDKESDWGRSDPFDSSYGELKESDAKLIKYLARHNHFTPFTHCTITLRETVPIFVARQRFKHTVGFSYNEVSRRYVDDTPEFYTPEVWRGRPEGSVKQGSSDEQIGFIEFGQEILEVDQEYHEFIHHCRSFYDMLIKGGVAPEQARMVLPQSMYTSYYVTGSLYAFSRAYKLRSDRHSQKEIQDLAAMWDSILRSRYEYSWSALVD